MKWPWEWISNMWFWKSKPEPIRHARRICICGKEIAVCKDGKFYKHKCESSGQTYLSVTTQLTPEDQQDWRR